MNMTCKKCGCTEFTMHEYDHMNPQRYDGVSEYQCQGCGTSYGAWTGNIIPEGFHEPRLGEWNVYKICNRLEKGTLFSACGYPRAVQGGDIDLETVKYPLNEWARPHPGKGKLYCYETFQQALYSGFSGTLVKCIGEGVTPGEDYDKDSKGAYYEGLGRDFKMGELRADALKVVRIYGRVFELKKACSDQRLG